jgi:DNA-binding Lrp family transcriptional regulator
VLRGAHGDVDPKALGIGLEVLFLIELPKHERGGVDRFMAEVVEIPEVRSAAPILGFASAFNRA